MERAEVVSLSRSTREERYIMSDEIILWASLARGTALGLASGGSKAKHCIGEEL